MWRDLDEMTTERVDPCPKCGGWLLPLLFGPPTPDLFETKRRGEVALGGFVIGVDDPVWECAACGARFRERDVTFSVP
jgi:hypothetical protein